MADASTQYLIDIATKLTGTSDASSALADLGAKMVETGASAKQLDAAVIAAKGSLAEAAAASTAAAQAVTEAQSAYNQNEAAATRAAKAAEKLGADVEAAAAKLASMRDADTGELGAGYEAAAAKLASLEGAQAKAQAKSTALAGALEGEGAALDALKAKAAEAKSAHEQLAEGVGVLEDGAKKAQKAEDAAGGSGKVNELGEAFGKLGGPVGAAGQKVAGLVEGFGKMGGAAGLGVGACVALTVVVLALVAAFVAGVVAIARWAVGLADASRNAKLATEALEASDKAFAGIGKTLTEVQDATGLTTDHLTGLAKQLKDAGVSAKDMPAALKAAALAEAALGQGAAAKLVEDLKSGKKSAGELAKEMQSKFGGIVAKKMLSLDAQAATLKSNLAETFGGLNIEPLLGALAKMVGLLDKNSESGKAIKYVFESLFQPLIDGAAAAYPTIERFFLGILIGALKLYIAFKPAIRALAELSEAGDGSGFDWLKTGEVIAYTLVAAFVILAAVVGLALLPFVLLGVVIYQTISAAQDVIGAFGELGAAILGVFDGIDLAGAGAALIDGLVQGILGGASAVVSAITSVAQSAVGAAESALKIRSPSKVFADIGGYTSEGFAEGVESAAPAARTALEDMVAAPDASDMSGAGAAAGSQGAPAGGVSLRIDRLEVHGGAKEAALEFVDQVVMLLEGKVLQSGGGALAPAA